MSVNLAPGSESAEIVDEKSVLSPIRFFVDRSISINKWPYNSVLTQQHLCKKLPKSVNVRWSCSVLHHCRFFEIVFFWDTVYIQFQDQNCGLREIGLHEISKTAATLWVSLNIRWALGMMY